MKKSATHALFFSLALPVFAEVELTGNPNELSNYLTTIPETVMIEGHAEKKLPADQAIIHLKVTTENKSMDAALEENRTLRQEITAKLLAAGLHKERIQADQFASTPESGFFTDKIKNYKVANVLKATVTNEVEFRAVAALVDAHDEITYEKTEFELSNEKEIKQQLLAEACREVTAKKSVYETGLQVSLTPVSFHSGEPARPQPLLARARTAAYGISSLKPEADSFSPPPPTQFDEMELSISVTVQFSLIAK